MKISITKILKNNVVRKILIAAFWLILWQLLYIAVEQEILIVSPVQVFFRIFELSGDSKFWLNTVASMVRILAGFLVAVATGLLLSIVTYQIKFVYELMYPIISIIKATPVASFIILALVWMKGNYVPAFTAFLMVLPIVWANVLNGIKKTDSKLLEMAKVYNLSHSKILRYIYIPSVSPFFMAACTTAMGLAWKAGIAAEVLANTKFSIGGQIYSAKIYLETVDLFAWTVIVILMSVLLEKLMIFIMGKCSKKLCVA